MYVPIFQDRITKLVEEKTKQAIAAMIQSGDLLLPKKKDEIHTCQPIKNRVHVAKLPSEATMTSLKGNKTSLRM